MNTREVGEIRRHIRRDRSNITAIYCCYVNTNKEIIYEEKDGEKIPITQKVIMPKMEGAIITAEGASNVNIKTNIIQAVSAATGLSTYRIQVFEMNV